MAKETTVKLSCEALGIKEQVYPIQHAQDLLDIESKMGVNNWKLTDSKFKLNNGKIERSNSGPDQGAGSQEPSGQGEKK